MRTFGEVQDPAAAVEQLAEQAPGAGLVAGAPPVDGPAPLPPEPCPVPPVLPAIVAPPVPVVPLCPDVPVLAPEPRPEPTLEPGLGPMLAPPVPTAPVPVTGFPFGDPDPLPLQA
ncbi:MAG: hypothetical protein ACHQ53_10010 [Polyangiales bacterium]